MNTRIDKQIDGQTLSDAEAALIAKAKEKEENNAFNEAQEAVVGKILYIIKSILKNLSNAMYIINHYAHLTSMASGAINLVLSLPGAVIGPLGAMFQLLVMFSNDKISVASKLVNFFTMTGSSGTSIASLILHSIAFPLTMTSASLSLIRDSWSLGEMLYRKYYENDTSITSLEWFNAGQSVILSAISLIAAGLLITPVAPLGYLLLAGVGLYKLADSLGYNPIKMLFNLYDDEKTTTPVVAIKGTSTLKMENVLGVDHTTAPSMVVEPCKTLEAVIEGITVDEPVKVNDYTYTMRM